MTESPKISVVIPVYNREKYVQSAVDSILSQTFSDFELLVIDDGSTDGSIAVVQSYSDPRIRFVRNNTNLGVSATRDKGIQLARGEYLAFLDSDDCAYPDRLRKQTAFLDNHPDYAAVGSWSEWMSEEGHPSGRIKRKPTSSKEIAAWRLFQQGIENSPVWPALMCYVRTGIEKNSMSVRISNSGRASLPITSSPLYLKSWCLVGSMLDNLPKKRPLAQKGNDWLSMQRNSTSSVFLLQIVTSNVTCYCAVCANGGSDQISSTLNGQRRGYCGWRRRITGQVVIRSRSSHDCLATSG